MKLLCFASIVAAFGMFAYLAIEQFKQHDYWRAGAYTVIGILIVIFMIMEWKRDLDSANN